MTRRFGIRARFALWFGLVGSALVLTGSALTYLAVSRTTLEGLDRELAVRADALLARYADEDGAEGLEAGADELADLAGTTRLRWLEVRAWPSGRVLLARGVPPEAAGAPPPGPTDATYTLRHRTLEDERELAGQEEDVDDRVCELVGASPATGGLVQVRVAADLEPLEERLDAYLQPLLGLDLLLVLVAAAVGFLLAGRLTRPILALRDAALRARDGGACAMPRSARGDELDELAGTLETSFRALDAALQRQRRFTADAAHELRNPLAALLSTAEVALRQPRDAEQCRALFGDVRGEALRMSRVLEALLLLARQDAGASRDEHVPVAVHELLRALATRRAELGPAITVAGEGEVTGDRALLEVLFENLLSNAQRYGPPGEAVRVRIDAHDGRVAVEVADRGPGIPAELRERVFERFARGSDAGARGGTAGLGLAIAAAIAAHHGGTIAVLEVPIGATLRVELPGRAENVETARAAP